MNNRTQLETLQRTWKPPRELDRSRPRSVSLKAGGWALAVVAGAFLVGAEVAGIWLAQEAIRQGKEQRYFEQHAVETKAEVTRLWRTKGDEPRHRAAYRFNAEGREFEGQTNMPRRAWSQLKVGSPFAVRYLPSDPAESLPAGRKKSALPMAVPYGVGVAMLIAGVLTLLPVRQQRRLLMDGRPAPAVVTRHKRDKHGQIPCYDFLPLSGVIAAGHGEAARKPSAIGSPLTVLYDPDNPRRNSPYPLSLVSCATDSLR